MKKLIKRNPGIIVALIALFVSSPIFAQPSGRGPQGPPAIPNAKQVKEMVADLSQELSLNEEQEAKISTMYVAHFDKIKELTQAGRPDRNKMEAEKTEFEKEVKSVLTKDQQKLFVAYQKKNDSRQGGQRPRK